MHTINTTKEFPSDTQEHLDATNTSPAGKMSKLLSVATLIAASLTTCTTQTPSRNGQNNTNNELSYKDWTTRENEQSITLKSHNRGNIVDLGVFQDQSNQLHAFRVLDRTEVQTYRYPQTPTQCDKICINIANNQQDHAAIFEDPFCQNSTTTYGTLAEDYALSTAGVTKITYIDLNSSEQTAPINETKHVLAQVQPGNTCTNLLLKTANTGTSTTRITGMPNVVDSNNELKNVQQQVNTIQDNVDKINQIVENHTEIIDRFNHCNNNPQDQICVEARKTVRHNATDTTKARIENNPY